MASTRGSCYSAMGACDGAELLGGHAESLRWCTEGSKPLPAVADHLVKLALTRAFTVSHL